MGYKGKNAKRTRKNSAMFYLNVVGYKEEDNIPLFGWKDVLFERSGI
ncbi:hypothetical protein B4135_2073 [Caldibacillus debilis]|uniref:Uncharacterized protein n=1 Tax=Caldibacillus debilis TaxID=301148 RepID=A0A150M558_9BACI|nr:hypothetical protein B4135_2073 [Caldibacillus debilis]